MGREGQGLDDPLLSWAGLCAPGIRSTSFDTLCGSVRQDAGGVGAPVSVGAARAMSEVPGPSGLGARVCGGVFR